jgi:hypothetical protein
MNDDKNDVRLACLCNQSNCQVFFLLYQSFWDKIYPRKYKALRLRTFQRNFLKMMKDFVENIDFLTNFKRFIKVDLKKKYSIYAFPSLFFLTCYFKIIVQILLEN